MGRAPPRPQRRSPGMQCAPGPAPSATAANGWRRRGALSGDAGRGCSWRAGAARPGAERGWAVSAARCGAGGQRSAFPPQPAPRRVCGSCEEPASVGSAGPEAREASGPPFWVSGSSGTGRSGRSGAPRRRFRSCCAGGGRRFRPCPLPRDRRRQLSVPVLRPAGAVRLVPSCARPSAAPRFFGR